MEFDIELHKIFGMKKHSFGDIQFLLVIKTFVQWRRQISLTKFDSNNHWYDDTNFPLSVSTSFVLQTNLLTMNGSTSWASTLTWMPFMNKVDATYLAQYKGDNYNLSISMIGKA